MISDDYSYFELRTYLGPGLDELTPVELLAVAKDLDELLAEGLKPFAAMRELIRRIGGTRNLKPYAKSLTARKETNGAS